MMRQSKSVIVLLVACSGQPESRLQANLSRFLDNIGVHDINFSALHAGDNCKSDPVALHCVAVRLWSAGPHPLRHSARSQQSPCCQVSWCVPISSDHMCPLPKCCMTLSQTSFGDTEGKREQDADKKSPLISVTEGCYMPVPPK